MADLLRHASHEGRSVAELLCGTVACWFLACSPPSAAWVAQIDLGVGSQAAIAAPSLAVGFDRTCVLRDRVLICWGAGEPPIAITSIVNATHVAASSHGMVVGTGDGDVIEWVDPGIPDAARRVHIGTIADLSVDRAQDRVCAVDMGGGVHCWLLGQPASVMAPILGASRIAVGAGFACATGAAPGAYCWRTDTDVPASVTPCASGASSLRVAEVSSIGAWRDRFWSISGGDLTLSGEVPSWHVNTPGVVQLCQGAGFECAVLSSGTIVCSGDSLGGVLGDGVETGSSEYSVDHHFNEAVEVACGDRRACGRMRNGQIFCWGQNFPWGVLSSEVGATTPTEVVLPPG